MTDLGYLDQRGIAKRIVVTGRLTLATPAHLGNGETAGATDMPLLLDPAQGCALLTGASLAGALRSFLWEYEMGYGVPFTSSNAAHRSSLAVRLFGGGQGDSDGLQSPLIVDDALAAPPRVELRDGVGIEPFARTADDEKKYDLELLRAGTTFELHLELCVAVGERELKKRVRQEQDRMGRDPDGGETQALRRELLAEQEAALRRGLALSLAALERGEIGLGARKRRGLGRCAAGGWQVREYDLMTRDGLRAWLASGSDAAGPDAEPDRAPAQAGESILSLLYPAGHEQVIPADLAGRRCEFRIVAHFWLDGSLLVRSAQGELDEASPQDLAAYRGADSAHLHRPRADGAAGLPVLPGTSLAGAVRAQAQRIARLLQGAAGDKLIADMFGCGPADLPDIPGPTPQPWASRVVVEETVLKGVRSLVQNRTRIDRFTGSVLDQYLFNEEPVFGGPGSQVEIAIRLRIPHKQVAREQGLSRRAEAEIGLLLLVLKDLWTGDVALGGGANVGRGRLRGLDGELTLRGAGDTDDAWRLAQSWQDHKPGALEVTGARVARLDGFVRALAAVEEVQA